jgi:DNA repair exonuclease SbcCD nuclease subunit
MSKVLFFADLHIHPHKRSSERLQHCIDALKWIFSEANKRHIGDIVFLGDLFHDRQKIDVLTYQKTFEAFSFWQQNEWAAEGPTHFRIFLLLGNHDLWHLQKWDISSVNPLRAMPGVHVIDKPSTLEVAGHPVAFLPYTADPIEGLKEVEKTFEEFKPPHKFCTVPPPRKILCGHVAVDGALWNTMHQTFSEVTIEHDGEMKVVNASIFKDWDRVFLGHYHAAQKISYNVEYIGSPLQLSFGEAFQKKKFLIYDMQTGDHEYVENDFSPQHFIIPQEDLHKYDLEGNFIRVIVDDIAAGDVVQMRKDLIEEQHVGSRDIKPAPKDEGHVVKDTESMLMKHDEMMEGYVDLVELGDLDKDKLLAIGKKICEGTEIQ